MKRWVIVSLIAGIISSAAITYCIAAPSTQAQVRYFPKTNLKSQPLTATQLNLPHAAIGYLDPLSQEPICRYVGQAANNGQIRATASLAKTITVQVVLDHLAKQRGDSNPVLTISPEDVAGYSQAVREGGSRVQVFAGEKLTLQQAIAGIMLRSANNLADTVARWAFGSLEQYRVAATDWLARHQIDHTTIGSDASGFNPNTTSTATDLCKIILLATKNPTLTAILRQPSVDLPLVGSVHTTNRLLGQQNIFAGKTGFNNEAGHGVLLASKLTGAMNLTIGVVNLGVASYNDAFVGASQLVDAANHDIANFTLTRDKVIGQLQQRSGVRGIVTAAGQTVPYFVDEPPQYRIQLPSTLQNINTSQAVVGQLQLGTSRVNLITK